ncbi:MAG: CopD family protein [Cryomorphaceae bacterium]|nr:CopD family protein [Cryomorphaceae bacterium]
MLYLKSLHIIFVVTWFAGLFYIVRLFVYAAEARTDPDQTKQKILLDQFFLMQRRLWYGITWPSAILTFIFGHWVLIELGWHTQMLTDGFSWLLIKYILVWLLLGYHLYCHKIFIQQQKGIFKHTGNQLRIWNEVATLLLVSIVFLVVVKSALSLIYGAFGLVLFAAILMLAIRVYRKVRG